MRLRWLCTGMIPRRVVFAVWILGIAAPCRSDAPRLRVLVLSGQNNHDWRTTTPALARILEQSGRFTVEITDHPERCTASSLARFSAIVSNWNAFGDAAVREWPAAAREAVLGFVRGGKGFVVVHAGSSSFPDWAEYRQITGAWWDLSRTGHGAIHEFYVRTIDPNHPITQGLRLFPTRDELWHRAGTSPGAHPIVAAFSSPESGGSGQDEPLAFVTEFGRGRGFTLLLGHDAAATESAGFRLLLCRGTEWAATGRVTLPLPPALLDGRQLAALLDQVRGYRWGDRREPLWMLEAYAGRVANTPAAPQLAEKLAAIAADTGAAPAGREAACRTLGSVGGPAQTAALAALLRDPALGSVARMALERIPGPEALAALRSALSSATGATRVGIVNSLGARRDAHSTGLLRALLRETDRETVDAALIALGRIGTPQALQVLQAFRRGAGPVERGTCARALVTCADRLAAQGATALAVGVYRAVLTGESDPAVRVSAFSGLVRADRVGRVGRLLSALRGGDRPLRSAAARLLAAEPEGVRAAAAIADRLPADVQPAVFGAISSVRERTALPAALRAAAGADPEARRAALTALGEIGSAQAVPTLARSAASSDARTRAASREALARLRGAGVDEAMVVAASRAQPVAQRELIRALVARSAHSAAPALVDLARRSPAVRAEAAAAVGALGGAAEIRPMLRLLADAGDARSDVENALAALCTRAHTSGPILAALGAASGSYRASLLAVLGAVGGSEALGALRSALHSSDAQSRTAAIQALASWPDAAPLEDLLAAAKEASDASACSLALRGVAQLAPLATDRPPERVAAVIREALAVARRVEDRKALVSALGKAACLDALKAAEDAAGEEGLRDEAALAALQVASAIWRRHPAEAEQTARRSAASENSDVRALAASLLSKLSRAENLAIGARATNLDGLHPDGQGGGPEAAIDGDSATYWDEEDNQKLYVLHVQLAQPAVVSVLRIEGFQQHQYAPRDFEVLLDGKVVKRVSNAQYTANWLQVDLPPTRCSTVELRITGYYGASPAIRELEIYSRLPRALETTAR